MRYRDLYLMSRSWCALSALEFSTPAVMDEAASLWLEEEYLEGEHSSKGAYMVAAIKYFHPEYSRVCCFSLPCSAQALAGWKRLDPSMSRLPLPLEVVALIALRLAASTFWEMGLLVMLAVAWYLRPSEGFRINMSQLTAPLPRWGQVYQHWTVVLHPAEEWEPSKTN